MSEENTNQDMEQSTPNQLEPMEELQKEFNMLCTQAGDLQFKIEYNKAQLAQINVRMAQINDEGAKLFAKKQAADAETMRKAQEKRERKAELKVAKQESPKTE